jgi:GT2 family glycosyltransferase
MHDSGQRVSVVIVTYNRSQVLVNTIRYLFEQVAFEQLVLEIVIVDQTVAHTQEAEQALTAWARKGVIRWFRLDQPNLTGAMNRGLMEARGDLVLYLDDDIIPDKLLIQEHVEAHTKHPDVAAVIGQVLQPGQAPVDVDYQPREGILRAYMDFPFNSTQGCFIENAMAGNMSLKKHHALAVGGFDEQFIPPVAARFESEFAKRLVRSGRTIWYQPTASIHHLAVSSGGTRAKGSHLNSAAAYFGFGDYYFALRVGSKWESARYLLKRFFREVRTKYHLRHPWYIPVKWTGEVRAYLQAREACKQPQALIGSHSPTSQGRSLHK